MTIWTVADRGTRNVFVCGACAVSFYNADRENREAPREGVAEDGAKVIPCKDDADAARAVR